MILIDLVKNLLNLRKRIDIKVLPSQGLFYKNNFEIKIKRASVEDIIEYESGYINNNIVSIINQVKKVVEKNIILSDGYKYEDIKSIDMIFIFLEIVKFTKGSSIKIKYLKDNGKEHSAEFSHKTFNYFFMNEMMEFYDEKNKQFIINDYKYTLPSIGVEKCLTDFLISKSNTTESNLYNDYYYDFTYFLGDKNNLSFNEIENLIQVFNYDIEDDEIEKINLILSYFLPIQRYTLIKNGKVIDVNSKLDLEKIWR